MSNLQPEEADTKSRLLRLKTLLEALRVVVRSACVSEDAPDAKVTYKDVVAKFGTSRSPARRFWEQNGAGGEQLIKAIQAGTNDQSCEEILQLLSLPVNVRSLLPFPVEAIELVFEIQATYEVARSQAGISQKHQMNGTDFASFFGDNQAFIANVVIQNRSLMGTYTPEMDQQIRDVIKAHDWSTVRPTTVETTKPTSPKLTQLKQLIAELRPAYPSDNAFYIAWGVHPNSVKNALAGEGKPHVLDGLLSKARALRKTLAPAKAVTPVSSVVAATATQVEAGEPDDFVGFAISTLKALVRAMESVRVPSDTITDKHRSDLLNIFTRLSNLAGINEVTLKRLLTVEGLSWDDPALSVVLTALGGRKIR